MQLYHVTLGYKTPSGNYSYKTYQAIAAQSRESALNQGKERFLSELRFNKRKFQSFTNCDCYFIGNQIKTR